MVLLFGDDVDVPHDDDLPPLLEDEDGEFDTSHWFQVQDELPHALRMRIMTMQQTAALSEMAPPLFITCDHHISHLTCDNHSSHLTWCWREDLSPCTPTIILMSPIISTDDEDSDDEDAG